MTRTSVSAALSVKADAVLEDAPSTTGQEPHAEALRASLGLKGPW